MSSRIDFLEVLHIGEGVGYIATATARDLHLAQRLRATLVDCYGVALIKFFQGDGKEISRSATADDSDGHLLFSNVDIEEVCGITLCEFVVTSRDVHDHLSVGVRLLCCAINLDSLVIICFC